MTGLKDLLLRKIAANGPMNLAQYMSECLLHPQFGYYTTGDPLGAAGDFTTSPEISQMFGELIGLSLAQAWLDHGAPEAFTLAELGPGRGTLMADILRAGAGVPGFLTAARVHLLEVSHSLREKQSQILAGQDVRWIESIADLPDAPLFLVANEFFDALPIRQFTRDRQGWRETQIGAVDGDLVFGLSAPTPNSILDHRLADTQPGDIVEIRLQAESIVSEIADRIGRHGGVALLIDYGDWRSLGDTFQAVRHHKTEHPLAQPGRADLTAHVDFEALAAAAKGIDVTPLTPQGVVLERLGISARANVLAQRLQGPALDSHIAAHRRLTHPMEMGTLFKMIALHHPGSPVPPGFVQ